MVRAAAQRAGIPGRDAARGELKTVNEILLKYAACISLEAPEARRTTAIGLSDLAEFYGAATAAR